MNQTYKPMSSLMKVVFWFVVINAYAGAASLILFPTDTRSTFFWDIAPLINARMFGVLYLAAGSLVLQALIRGWWEPARYLTAMVPAFTGMMLATTLVHIDVFDPGLELSYWLMVYIVAPLAAIFFYMQHERGGAEWRVVSQPVAPIPRAIAIATGVVAALFAAVIFIAPDLITGRWPWTISPLMVRVFSAWVSAFALSLLWFGVERDWERVKPVASLIVVAAALMLLVLAIHREALRPDAVSVALFVSGIVLVGSIGAFIVWYQDHRSAGRAFGSEPGP